MDGKLRSCLWSLSAGRSLLAVLTDNWVGSLSTVSVPPGKRIHLSGTWEQLEGRSQGLGTGEGYLASPAYRTWGEVCSKHRWWGTWVVKVQVLQHLDVGGRPVGLLSLSALRASSWSSADPPGIDSGAQQALPLVPFGTLWTDREGEVLSLGGNAPFGGQWKGHSGGKQGKHVNPQATC